MTTDVRTEVANPPGSSGARVERRARRIAQLYASDPQLQAAEPIPAVIDAARRPGLRLPEVIETLVEGYTDRPALGQRARELVLDPATGRTTTRLLPTFETTSYGDLWATVRAVAAAWRRDETSPVNPGDFEPGVLAAGAAYLDLAVESALQSTSLRHLVVFDYQPQVDEHRENLERARKRLHDAGVPVVVSTLDEVIARGRELPS